MLGRLTKQPTGSEAQRPSGKPPPLRILEERQWSLDSGSVESTWSFVGETISSYRVWMRIYTYRELCELLRAAGFSRFEAFETGTQKTFRLGSPRLALIAEK